MPRKARLIVPNLPHHVVQRGHIRNAVFVERQDYEYYLETLQEWKYELGIRVYAWCLMTNHVHLNGSFLDAFPVGCSAMAYQAFVEQGVDSSEHRFISERLQRNGLTGGDSFVNEIERRIGIRIEARRPGRPAKV